MRSITDVVSADDSGEVDVSGLGSASDYCLVEDWALVGSGMATHMEASVMVTHMEDSDMAMAIHTDDMDLVFTSRIF